MAKILKVSFMRDLEAQLIREEITYNRMLELIEEKVLEHCVLKDGLLAEIDKNINYVNDNKDHVFGGSQIWTGHSAQKAIVSNLEIVKEWALKYNTQKTYLFERPKSEINQKESQGQHENQENKTKACGCPTEPYNPIIEAPRNVAKYGNCIATQTGLNAMDARCSKCGHKWNIEKPALYKETFCPKCGE